MYEVLISPFARPAETVFVGRYEDAHDAIQASRTEQSCRPDYVAFVFLWLSPQTRILHYHTLGGFAQ